MRSVFEPGFDAGCDDGDRGGSSGEGLYGAVVGDVGICTSVPVDGCPSPTGAAEGEEVPSPIEGGMVAAEVSARCDGIVET